MIPPWVRPESPETIRMIDDATVAFQPAFGRGMTQRGIFADPRWGLRRRYRGLRSDEKAAILNALNESRGQFNNIRVTPHTPFRGSFATSELLANGTFASGTTGWTPSACTLSVADRVLRATASRGYDGSIVPQAASANFTTVAYAPYVLRQLTLPGRGNLGDAGPFASDSSYTSSGYGSYGLRFATLVPIGTSMNFTIVAGVASSGYTAGDYVAIPYCSAARCALVDNGPNLLLRSDEFDNSGVWTRNALNAVTANAVASPDGTTTAESITETTANAAHYLTQAITVSPAVGDYAFMIAVKGNLRNIIWMECDPGTGGGGAYFDLNASTSSVYNGVSAVNTRAFIVDLGNSWRLCAIVTKKTSASTTLNFAIGATSTNGLKAYAGSTASAAVYLWRGTGSQSGVPSRLVQTTSAATTGSTQTGGGVYSKGWPASTNGLLLPGDWIEINGELKQITAPVNSDAAGLAYVQFRPGLAGSPADSDPIVVQEPFGRFIYPGTREFENLFGIYGDCEMNLEEVYS